MTAPASDPAVADLRRRRSFWRVPGYGTYERPPLDPTPPPPGEGSERRGGRGGGRDPLDRLAAGGPYVGLPLRDVPRYDDSDLPPDVARAVRMDPRDLARLREDPLALLDLGLATRRAGFGRRADYCPSLAAKRTLRP